MTESSTPQTPENVVVATESAVGGLTPAAGGSGEADPSSKPGKGALPGDPASDQSEQVQETDPAVLREQAAAERVARASAEERYGLAVEKLYLSCLELATAGILRDPSDLPGGPDDFRGEDGMPSLDKIREAATKLANEKPHLASPRVPSAQLQGPTSQPPSQIGLGSILRNAAS